jgi:hypothetical protein
VVVLALATCLSVGAAAGTSFGQIPFRTVAHAAAAGVEPKRPTVILATAATGAGRIAALLKEPHARRVRAVDLHAHTLVAAFAGTKPSSGYAITIRRLSLRGPVLDVVVTLRTPRPGGYSLPAFTSPYAVAEIAHDAAAGAQRWRLVTTRGRVLGRGSLPR